MKNIIAVINLFLFILLLACSDQSYIEPKEINPDGKLSDDNVFKDYETAIDKAKGVEQTIMDTAQQRQNEMDSRGY